MSYLPPYGAPWVLERSLGMKSGTGTGWLPVAQGVSGHTVECGMPWYCPGGSYVLTFLTRALPPPLERTPLPQPSGPQQPWTQGLVQMVTRVSTPGTGLHETYAWWPSLANPEVKVGCIFPGTQLPLMSDMQLPWGVGAVYDAPGTEGGVVLSVAVVPDGRGLRGWRHRRRDRMMRGSRTPSCG